MNNVGFLASDFQQIKAKSDDAVFEMLKKQNADDVKMSERPAKQPPAKTMQPRTEKTKRPKSVAASTSLPKKNESLQWGKPVALFNTRIPQELSDLLDDLVYQRKKEGSPTTKQAIAIKALSLFVQSRISTAE